MRATASAIFALLVAVGVGACKKSEGRASTDLADDIDAIESALNESDRELANEGVVVAYRSTPGVHAEPGGADATPTTPPPEPGTDVDPLPPPEPAPDAGDDAPELHASAPVEEHSPVVRARDSESLEREKSPRRNRRARMSKSSGPPTRCERLCGLAGSTCDLRDRICRMAERHFGDIRYATSCQRAEDQCEAVRRQCESCAA